MSEFWGNLRDCNIARCALWDPGGVGDWSASDWFAATVGEFGELLEAVGRFEQLAADERAFASLRPIAHKAADVVIYLDLLFARLDLPVLREDEIGSVCGEWRDRPARGMATELCLIGDLIKKLNRARDGVAGNRADAETYLAEVDRRGRAALGLLWAISLRFGFSLRLAIVEKFNAVSERNGFAVFMPAEAVDHD